MKKITCITFLLMSFNFLIAQTLDQDHYTSISANTSFNISTSNNNSGQSFTSGLTGNLTSIKVVISNSDQDFFCNPGTRYTTFEMQLQTGDGFSGAILGTSSSITLGTTGFALTEFIFPSPIAVVSGSMYTFKVNILPLGCPVMTSRLRATQNGTYPNGTGYQNGVPHTSQILFQTFVSAAIPPEFITTWNTENTGTFTTANNQITINYPTWEALPNFDVDWGDGTTSTGLTSTTSHTYAVPGIYSVAITGDFPVLYLGGHADGIKLVSIDQWGTQQWTSLSGAFVTCSNLASYTAMDSPDLSQVTSLQSMFRLASSFNGNINSWNVSTITDMTAMFEHATTFNQPLNSWDVSSALEMNEMFHNATSFNQPLNNWVVGGVVDMERMFHDATTFNQDIGNWDVSSVNRMGAYSGEGIEGYGMFQGATAFNQDLSLWDTSNVNEMGRMFQNATAFNQDLSAWDISNVQFMRDMFLDAGLSTLNYDNTLIGWNTLSGTETQIPMWIDFHGGNSVYCNSATERQDLITNYGWNITDGGSCPLPFITTWKTDNPGNSNDNTIRIPIGTGTFNYTVNWGDGSTDTTEYNNDATHTYATIGTYTVSISGDFPHMEFSYSDDNDKLISVQQWGTQQWTSMKNMFYNCDNLVFTATDVPDLSLVSDMTFMFNYSNFNTDISNWDVSTVTNMYGMFESSGFNQSIDNWDVSNVTTMQRMFSISAFNQPLDSWDVSSVTNMQRMFANSQFNQPLDNWNVSSVTAMRYMFEGSVYNQPINNWNVTNVTDMGQMFTSSIFNQPINNWNVSSVTDMELMFANSIFNQPIDNWNVSSVTDMNGMFKSSEFNQPIDNWNVSSVIAMSNMFSFSIFDQPINNWNVSSVTSMYDMFNSSIFNQAINNWNVNSVTDMTGMFAYSTFNQPIDNWNVSSVADMTRMFGYSNFNLDISSWDVSNVIYMNEMFENSIFNQPIDNWNVSSVTEMSYMFYSSIFNQPINNWDVSSVLRMGGMFYNATLFNQDISNWDVSSVTVFGAAQSPWGPFVTGNGMFEGATAFNQDLSSWDISSATSLHYMFTDAGLSLDNYDNTLIGWNTLDTGETQIPTGVTFHGGNSIYCNGETARDNLINTHGWTITDGGLDCSSLGTDEFDEPTITLFPNPIISSFKIKGLDNDTYGLQIVNLHGQLVKQINHYNGQSISIDNLASGVYFVTIRNNKIKQTIKIIKQ